MDERTRLRELMETGLARVVRTAAQLSLRDAAKRAGLQPSTVLRWERGDRSPTDPDAASRYLAVLDRLMKGGRDAA